MPPALPCRLSSCGLCRDMAAPLCPARGHGADGSRRPGLLGPPPAGGARPGSVLLPSGAGGERFGTRAQ